MIMLKQFNIAGREIACWINPRDFGSYQQNLIFIHGSGSRITWKNYHHKLE